MLRSMYSGVTGLRSHQTKMDVIGNNIANVNTTAFKASRVTFQDVYYQTMQSASAPTDTQAGSNPTQIGYGAMVSSVDILNSRGGVQLTDKPLDLYISGDGYFVVQDAADAQMYTRAGNFSFDASGNLVDSNGNKVCGWMPDKKTADAAALFTGQPLPEARPIKIGEFIDVMLRSLDGISLADSVTINDYSNIAVGPDGTISAVYDGAAPSHIPGIDETLGKILGFSLNAGNYTDVKVSVNGTVTGIYSSITHITGMNENIGSVDISAFDAAYNMADYTNFRLSKLGGITADYIGVTHTVGTAETLGQVPAFTLIPADYVNLSIQADGSVLGVYNVNPPAAGHTYGTTEALGTITDYSAYTANYANIQIAADGTVTGDYIGIPHTNGEAETIGNIPDFELSAADYSNITVAADGTVCADYTGISHINGIVENLGQLENFETNTQYFVNYRLENDGSVIAEYAGPAPAHIPGTSETLGQIALAKFTNPEALSQNGNTYFSATQNTGKMIVTNPGDKAVGELKASALEMSNVDLSKEFTDMITTQRGFQANSRIITVSDEILQELVNLKR